jgi:hypothetical protein
MGKNFALYFLHIKIKKQIGSPIEIIADIIINKIDNIETCIYTPLLLVCPVI